MTAGSPFIDALRGDLTAETIHRARLVAAMAEAAAEKGLAATTIADVVARARVSRRTFYEHFTDKHECFLAAYDAASNLLMAGIADAVETTDAPWDERVAAGVAAYLRTLASEPALTRLFLVEILAAGPEALRRRRAVHRRYAALVRDLFERHRPELPAGAELRPAMADALIGALNELVLLSVEEDRTDQLPDLEDTASELLRAVLAPTPTPEHR